MEISFFAKESNCKCEFTCQFGQSWKQVPLLVFGGVKLLTLNTSNPKNNPKQGQFGTQNWVVQLHFFGGCFGSGVFINRPF